MKNVLKTFTLLGLIAGALGVGAFSALQRENVEAEAATTNTKRVWMKNSITSTWDKDGAGTAIHYWGGASGTTWPGARVKWDAANQMVYYDIPADVTTYMFVRVSGVDPISDWGAKTADLVYTNSVGKYYDLTGPIAWNGAITPGSFVSFTPATTTIVTAFAATIDTSGEACNATAAQNAVNAYNALSTFEQDQFDVLSVGGGFTGLDRLNFLKSFYNITTPLNVIDRTDTLSKDSSVGSIILLSGLSITALGGYFFLQKKKFL